MAIPIWAHWGSCYDIVHDSHGEEIAVLKPDCTYPIGIDPIWYLAKNELAFMNSLKMKLSVILGVLQMSLGVCMKAANAIHFGNKLDLWLEFLPQIILLWVLFGYMDAMIIAKWLTDFTHREYEAPSVISSMIGMALNGGNLDPGQVAVIGSNSTQKAISILFLLIAVICVPWMLVPKPLIIDKENRLHHGGDEHEKNSIPMIEQAHEDKPLLQEGGSLREDAL
jgi:V-type H+-transporting ATPase subunit a